MLIVVRAMEYGTHGSDPPCYIYRRAHRPEGVLEHGLGCLWSRVVEQVECPFLVEGGEVVKGHREGACFQLVM